tara:strand:+ start:87 stop:1094 length:1008 start_codon:yes stop_codon:yes gene_type:complete
MDTKELETKLQDIESKDLSHPELGDRYSFIDAEAKKQEILEFFRDLKTRTEALAESIHAAYLQDWLAKINQRTDELLARAQDIEKLAEDGPKIENYEERRKKLITNLGNIETNSRRDLLPALTLIEAVEVKRLYEALDSAAIKEDAETSMEQVSKAAREADKILKNLRTSAAQTVVDRGSSSFGGLAERYASSERNWFRGLIVSGASLLVAFGVVIWLSLGLDAYESIEALTGLIFLKVSLLALPSLFLRLCLTKYNSERHLHILYRHRHSVLDQYKTFENSLSEDRAASNTFRIEMAKFIFSDPATGYTNSTNNSELQMNPVFNVLDTFTKKDT